MKALAKIATAAAMLTMAMLFVQQLLVLRTMDGDRNFVTRRQVQDGEPAVSVGRHGDPVPGEFLVEYASGQSLDASNGDLVTSLAAKNIQATIVNSIHPALFHGAHVRVRGDQSNDGFLDTLTALPLVQNAAPVQIMLQSGDEEIVGEQDQKTEQGETEKSEKNEKKERNDLGTMEVGLDQGKTAGSMADPLTDEPVHRRDEEEHRIDYMHERTGVFAAHARAEPIDGRGVKIAILDDGIDQTHPDFGDCSDQGEGQGADCKIRLVRDVVAQFRTDEAASNPDQCKSIGGTMMASILLGGNSGLTFAGVAPGAAISVYRIFDCSGRSNLGLFLKALGEALDQKTEIVLHGRPFPLSVNMWRPLEIALQAAANAGTTVFVGNPVRVAHRVFTSGPADGVDGVFTVNTAVLDGWYSTFAEKILKHVTKPQIVVETDAVYRTDATGATDASGETRLPNVRYMPTKDVVVDNKYYKVVRAVPPGMLDMRICAPDFVFQEQADDEVLLVPNLGCLGFPHVHRGMMAANVRRLLYEYDGKYETDMFDAQPETVPFRGYISSSVTNNWARDWHVTIRLSDVRTRTLKAFMYLTHGTVDSLHWTLEPGYPIGPTHNLGLAPTLSAPGILQPVARAVDEGVYGLVSGPTASVAYAAGCAALVLQAAPGLRPKELQRVLVGTAQMARSPRNEASVLMQGGGVIDVGAALQSVLGAADPAKAAIAPNVTSLSLGDANADAAPHVFEVCNNQARASTYTITNFGVASLYLFRNSPNRLEWVKPDTHEFRRSPELRIDVGGGDDAAGGFTLEPKACRQVTVTVVNRRLALPGASRPPSVAGSVVGGDGGGDGAVDSDDDLPDLVSDNGSVVSDADPGGPMQLDANNAAANAAAAAAAAAANNGNDSDSDNDDVQSNSNMETTIPGPGTVAEKHLAMFSGYLSIWAAGAEGGADGVDGVRHAVPYIGCAGNMTSVSPIALTYLSTAAGGRETLVVGNNIEFIRQGLGKNIINLAVAFTVPPNLLVVEVRNAEGNQVVKTLLPRMQPTGNAVGGLGWDGFDDRRRPVHGQFYFVVHALRYGGDARNPDQWDHRATDTFRVRS